MIKYDKNPHMLVAVEKLYKLILYFLHKTTF